MPECLLEQGDGPSSAVEEEDGERGVEIEQFCGLYLQGGGGGGGVGGEMVEVGAVVLVNELLEALYDSLVVDFAPVLLHMKHRARKNTTQAERCCKEARLYPRDVLGSTFYDA